METLARHYGNLKHSLDQAPLLNSKIILHCIGDACSGDYGIKLNPIFLNAVCYYFNISLLIIYEIRTYRKFDG